MWVYSLVGDGGGQVVGKEGFEPSRLAATDPKSVLSANSSTSPITALFADFEPTKSGSPFGSAEAVCAYSTLPLGAASSISSLRASVVRVAMIYCFDLLEGP